jgi:hypothetical protein
MHFISQHGMFSNVTLKGSNDGASRDLDYPILLDPQYRYFHLKTGAEPAPETEGRSTLRNVIFNAF